MWGKWAQWIRSATGWLPSARVLLQIVEPFSPAFVTFGVPDAETAR